MIEIVLEPLPAFIAGSRTFSFPLTDRTAAPHPGSVIGVDMTGAQREKAEGLAKRDGFGHVTFVEGYLEELPVEDGSIDAVISNGVVNLCPDKERVFREVARVLRPGGRLALADIVTEKPLPEGVTCNATLWAACIGGAAQQDNYRAAVEAAGLRVTAVEDNPRYQFLSRSAQGASRDYGVKSVSLLAEKPL
ncbi:MAG: methyltransferase domain-containing protein [Gemmatimonadetes bacterium]|nr:methyltransferase domain-containing protein [Gemmatimonadota bacterium]